MTATTVPWWRNGAEAERWTLGLAIASAAALLACGLGIAVDGRLLDNGESVWLKPLRFALAFGVHMLTLLGLGRLAATTQGRLHPAFVAGLWLQIFTVQLEWACVAVQAARGVHSHFNYATAFDVWVFRAMGLGTAVLMLGIALCAWGVAQTSSRGALPRRGIVLGAFGLAVLGGLAGVCMVMPTAEQRALLEAGQRLVWIGGTTVGLPSGQRLPFFHWDLAAGDWRAVHFTGLHALQALPLLAWLAQRVPLAAGPPARRWAVAGAVAYALLFLAVLAWTLRGHSVMAVAQPGWPLLLLPVLVYALCALALLALGARRHGP